MGLEHLGEMELHFGIFHFLVVDGVESLVLGYSKIILPVTNFACKDKESCNGILRSKASF